MSKPKKILVVDDDRVILTFASKLLTREGHEVVTASDGFEALNVLSSFSPDIMFFDLCKLLLRRRKEVKREGTSLSIAVCYGTRKTNP